MPALGIGIGIPFALTSLAAQVAALFAAGGLGAWYDPSDFATLYQDSTGATPVTVVEQPVGLMLDKRLGLVRGPELAQYTPGTSVAASGASNISPALVAAKWYAVTVPAGFRLSGPSGFNAYVSTGVEQLVLTNAAGGFTVFNSTASAIILNNVSVKLLDGNHAIQATAASRPVLKAGGSMLLDGVDDSMSSATGGGATAGFFLCQAIKPTGGAGAVRTIWSDAGTNSGYLVQLNAANQLSLSAGNGTAYTTIATAAATVVGTTALVTAWDDGTNLNVQLDSGAVATIARPVVTAGTAAFTIGKDNGAATGFFNGNFYPEVYRTGTPVTAAERAQVQAYVRSKAGL